MPEPHVVQQPSTLLAALFAAWPEVKRKQVRAWLKTGAATINGQPTTQFDSPLKPGDVLAIRTDRFALTGTELTCGVKILHEDADVIVIEKPHNLLSVASDNERERTAYYRLTEYLRERNQNDRERVWIVHRLDRETSGLMVFARNEAAKDILQKNWDHAVKRYQAVVEGKPSTPEGKLESDLNETRPERVFSSAPGPDTRHAITHFRTLKEEGGCTLVELELETGRRHQIRVQLSEFGCPIAGDEKYDAKLGLTNRLALHATALAFPHPATGQMMEFSSPVPWALTRLVTPHPAKGGHERARKPAPIPIERRRDQPRRRPGKKTSSPRR